jgi:hypothetical protein
MAERENKIKWVWHPYHDVLIEPLIKPLKKHIDFLRVVESKDEQKIHLSLVKIVKGKLPKKLIEAGKEYIKAWEIAEKAYEDYIKVRDAYKGKIRKKYKTYKDYYWAVVRKAYYKALALVDKAVKTSAKIKKAINKEVLALHEKECPNCPWNGKTIFNKKWPKEKIK